MRGTNFPQLQFSPFSQLLHQNKTATKIEWSSCLAHQWCPDITNDLSSEGRRKDINSNLYIGPLLAYTRADHIKKLSEIPGLVEYCCQVTQGFLNTAHGLGITGGNTAPRDAWEHVWLPH